MLQSASPLAAGIFAAVGFFLLTTIIYWHTSTSGPRKVAAYWEGNDTSDLPPLLNKEAELELNLSALYAVATYCLPSRVKKWKCGYRCPGNLDIRRYLDTQGTTGVTGYVGFDADANRIVVAFRGSLDFRNWVWDLLFAKVDYHYPPDEMNGTLAAVISGESHKDHDPNGPMIHSGFWISYRSVRADAIEAVGNLLREIYFSRPPSPLPPSILVTGHSLGAALATFAALDYKVYQMPGWLGDQCCGEDVVITSSVNQRTFSEAAGRRKFEPPSITLHQFGGPRVGNLAFAELVRRAFVSPGQNEEESARHLGNSIQSRRPDRALRVVNRNDWVPHLPPVQLAFAHHPHEVWIGFNGGSSDYDDESSLRTRGMASRIVPPGIRIPRPAYNCTGDLSPQEFEDPRCSAKVPWWNWSLVSHGVLWGYEVTVLC